MILKRQSIWRVLLMSLFITLYLCTVPLSARADVAGGEGAAVAGVILIVAAYAVTMTVICVPVAAIRASDHPGRFGGTFGACFDVRNWFASGAAQTTEKKR